LVTAFFGIPGFPRTPTTWTPKQTNRKMTLELKKYLWTLLGKIHFLPRTLRSKKSLLKF